MELNEKVNNEYKSDKAAYQKLQKAQTVLQRMERQLILAKRKKQDAQIKLIRAQEDKNAEKIEEAKSEVEIAEKEEEKVRQAIQGLKTKLEDSKEKVDSYIEELKKDPEFETHINGILEKRYNRKLNKEIAELNQLNLIIDLCDKHPTLGNNLKGMVRAQEELESLNAEIEPLDPVKDKDKLDEIQEKLTHPVQKKNLNIEMFMNHCSKNNINVSKDFLEKLVEENSFAHDKEGNIKLDKTLNNIAKGYNKRIKTYQKAIEKIPGAQLTVENGQALGIDPDPQGTQKTTVLQKLTSDPMSHVTQQTNSAQPPAKKFKWWQFKKRFDDWRQRRQANKQTTIDPATTTQTSTTGEVSTKKFRDAYKYDIVKDYVDSQEEQLFRQTARDVRRGDKTQDQDQDGQR